MPKEYNLKHSETKQTSGVQQVVFWRI